MQLRHLPIFLLLLSAAPVLFPGAEIMPARNPPFRPGLRRDFAGRNTPHSPFRIQKDFALFFATDTYNSPAWRNLNDPVKDARAIAADLHDLYGFDTTIVVNPTRKQALDKLIEYARKTYPADAQLFVFFSGHGHYDELAKDGYVIPRDGKPSADDPYGDSWLKHTDLRRRISGIPCSHILLAVDACFSGALDEAQVFKNENTDDFDRPGEAEAARNQRVADLLRPRTRLYITSGEKTYTPDPSEFAAQFKAGLRTLGGADGLLDIQGLYYNYLKKARSHPQIGAFEANETGSTFLFDYRNRYNPTATATLASLDPDADNVPSGLDGCPTEWAATPSGCPDADEDGIPDKDDACPYEAGTAARNGCPAAADRDGDGVPDPGDQCPDQKGPAKYQGCPDSDGDGVPDHKDNCPTEKGLPAENGCPEEKMPEYMVRIPGGTFEIGDQFGTGEADEEPLHTVTLSDFYLGKTEVTVGEFRAFVEASGYKTEAEKGDGSSIWDGSEWNKTAGVNWSQDEEGKPRADNYPVVHVTWNDAVAYCNWLSTQQGLTPVYTISGDQVTANWSANGYRLPTEAEWEYAARQGGQKVRFGNGKDIADPAEINFLGASDFKLPYSRTGETRAKTVPVASFPANNLGLHDMSGNVWEWCWDWYDSEYYSKSTGANNPYGPESGSSRVLRGGSWAWLSSLNRVSHRASDLPSLRNDNCGFRLCRNISVGSR